MDTESYPILNKHNHTGNRQIVEFNSQSLPPNQSLNVFIVGKTTPPSIPAVKAYADLWSTTAPINNIQYPPPLTPACLSPLGNADETRPLVSRKLTDTPAKYWFTCCSFRYFHPRLFAGRCRGLQRHAGPPPRVRALYTVPYAVHYPVAHDHFAIRRDAARRLRLCRVLQGRGLSQPNSVWGLPLTSTYYVGGGTCCRSCGQPRARLGFCSIKP